MLTLNDFIIPERAFRSETGEFDGENQLRTPVISDAFIEVNEEFDDSPEKLIAAPDSWMRINEALDNANNLGKHLFDFQFSIESWEEKCRELCEWRAFFPESREFTFPLELPGSDVKIYWTDNTVVVCQCNMRWEEICRITNFLYKFFSSPIFVLTAAVKSCITTSSRSSSEQNGQSITMDVLVHINNSLKQISEKNEIILSNLKRIWDRDNELQQKHPGSFAKIKNTLNNIQNNIKELQEIPVQHIVQALTETLNKIDGFIKTVYSVMHGENGWNSGGYLDKKQPSQAYDNVSNNMTGVQMTIKMLLEIIKT